MVGILASNNKINMNSATVEADLMCLFQAITYGEFVKTISAGRIIVRDFKNYKLNF